MISSSISPTIQLHVDNPNCTAGQLIKGCVCWSIEEANETSMIRSLELELLGYEQVVVTQLESSDTNTGTPQQQHVQKEILIKFPYTLHDFSSSSSSSATNSPNEESGQSYEYPFEWELSSSLPSTFHCKQTYQTIEIAYQLIAKAIPTRGRVTLQDTVPLHVQAASDMPAGKAIALGPEQMKIQSNAVFPRGVIRFGWNAPSDVLTTGSNVEITITGENRSQVDLKDFAVRLVETIVWKSPWTNSESKIDRIVTSACIEVNRQRQWLSQNAGEVMAPPTVVTLSIPDTHESYTSGTVLRIEHSIVVIAQTATDRTTNPRLSHPVYIVRRASEQPADE